MRDRRLLAVTALAALAIGAEAAEKTPRRGGTLNFAVVAEPPNYDCHAHTTFGVLHPVAPHYSTLLKYTGDWSNMRIEPDAALSWSATPDLLSFTFKLRRDVLFHDGSPLTSADVKATYERITWRSTSSPIMAMIPTSSMCTCCRQPCSRQCPIPSTRMG
jgi:peptide/nickel transport system substrate-binding protein